MPDQLEFAETQLSAEDRRLLSLAKANRLREDRAAIKRKLKSRELYLDDVLERFEPWPCIAGAPIAEILTSARGFGWGKVTRILRRFEIPATRKVEHVSHRQRKMLLRYLMREHPSAFYGAAAHRQYVC